MTNAEAAPLRRLSLDELIIDDDRELAIVDAYQRLKQVVRGSAHRFLVPAAGGLSWDRALFLNLTFWNGEEGDVLCDARIPADVVAHVGWHHLAGRELGRASPGAALGAAALLFGEAIASAFDLYLVGRLLPVRPDCDFITTQVPVMAEAAAEAGLAEAAFAALMQTVVDDPEFAFGELRTLLFEAATALMRCRGANEALAVLEGFAGHRFAPLLHHYQLSNWILYARAYGAGAAANEGPVLELDATLRAAPDALAWLLAHWLA